jgi:shikimate kinase
MVADLMSSRSVSRRGAAGPRVVEIIGPAGAGKTTLLHALGQRNARILPGITLSRQECLVALACECLCWLPSYLAPGRKAGLSRTELRSMAYVEAWYRRLGRPGRTGDSSITVFDQGPVFRLARLREFGAPQSRTRRYERWWAQRLEQWAEALDLVIWLDAPIPVLIERISRRGKQVGVEQGAELDRADFLTRYQQSFREVLGRMVQAAGPEVLRYDSHALSLDQIVTDVMGRLPAGRAND